jgi:CelD/BcsL family acetyltransferase involved in cellulose biosynthesis
VSVAAGLRAYVIESFDDPAVGPERWDALLASSSADLVSLSRQWQRSWWEASPFDELLLVVAERDGDVCALAPFYVAHGLVSFVGLGSAPYVELLGETTDDVVDAVLETAAAHAREFYGFSFHFVREGSPLGPLLQPAAGRLGLECYEEDSMPAPVSDLAGQREQVLALAGKKSLRRGEKALRREGALELRQFKRGEEIVPQLDTFFDQHIARWADTSSPSPYEDPGERERLCSQTRDLGDTGWLRFSRLELDGRPIAFDYGTCFRGRYVVGASSYAVDLAHCSPGQVLLRLLVLAAIDEGATTFDFGLGDQPYKLRLATHVETARAWGFYLP